MGRDFIIKDMGGNLFSVVLIVKNLEFLMFDSLVVFFDCFNCGFRL